MIQIKYKIQCSGNARNYGVKNGDWINKEIFKLIKKDVRSKGEEDIFYVAKKLVDDSIETMIWEKKYNSYDGF